MYVFRRLLSSCSVTAKASNHVILGHDANQTRYSHCRQLLLWEIDHFSLLTLAS